MRISQHGKPVRLKIPDKIVAVRKLVKVYGWAKPDRVEISATDTLSAFIESIRQAPRPRQCGMAEQAEDNGERG
jgi:hypothetical protein